MKLLLLLVALMFNASAFARLGETTEQIDQRYGRPVETNGETRRYVFRGFNILVGFGGGISECEIYHKTDNSRMTPSEINGLLHVNTGSSPWRDDADENMNNYVYWSKDKKARVAIYTLKTHALMVTSKAALPRYAPLANPNGRRKIEGF